MNYSPETKNSLIKAGIKLFALNAYSDISIDTIVTEANISKGTFYYYFKSKEEFYKYLFDYAFITLMNIYTTNSLNKKSKEELLYSFVYSVFEFFRNDKNLFFLIQRELVKIVIGEKSDLLDYQKKTLELLKEILKDEDPVLSFYVMGIIRSSIIYHLKTAEPLNSVLDKAWFYIKRLIKN